MKTREILLSSIVFVTLSIVALADSPATPPNDPFFGRQWGLHNDGTQTVQQSLDDLHTLNPTGTAGKDIGWLEARDEIAAMAKTPVTVAVIDSGIDPKHPDLAGRLAPNGLDLLAGVSGVTGTASMSDPMGHGTHVSGIVAANADNGIGIAGVTPSTIQVLPIRVLSDDFTNFSYRGVLISDYVANAINYAVAQKASVINMSLGWPTLLDTANARLAVQNAVKAGVLIVVAAGNDRKDEPTNPCDYEGVICVGATTNTGGAAYFTNFGGLVDVMAPGDWIFSLYPEGVEPLNSRIADYEYLSGTSQASPHVAGIAAILKSAFPSATPNELRARLLLSGGAPPAPGNALYGLANVKSALEASAQPVYLPDFKAMTAIPVDETSLSISGTLNVQNLWAAATQVQAQITINGVAAGSTQVASLASGATFSIPWKYTFASIDDASVPNLVLTVSDSNSTPRQFSTHIYVGRDMTKVQQTSFAVAGANASDWIGSSINSYMYSKANAVLSYPSSDSLPAYYQILGTTAAGTVLRIFDPSAATPISLVQVPNIIKFAQVIRIDANGDGNRDWLFTGIGQTATQQPYFQFYFLNPSFQPLWGSQSTWQVALDSTFGQMLVADYSKPGSWVKQGGHIVPALLAQGSLPPADNYNSLDQRHYQVDTHLYYLSLPTASASPAPAASPAPQQLTLRALDNIAFRAANPNAHIQNAIVPSPSDMTAGHLRLLFTSSAANIAGLNSPMDLWDIRSVTDSSTSTAPTGWDVLGSAGQPYVAGGSTASAYLSFFDDTTGTLAWTTSTGQFGGHTDFAFRAVGDPINGFVGAFDMTSKNLGRVWFLQSAWDLVGYQQLDASSPAQPQTLPIEHDTSFLVEQFSEMLSPVLVGTAANPLPGVYIDSTLVHGNRVAVDVLDPVTHQMQRPLRYSLIVPSGCVQMTPNTNPSDPSPESFVLPLLCQQGTQLLYRAVRPQP